MNDTRYPGIDVDEALRRMAGNRVVLASVLRSFSENYADAHQTIMNAWEAGDSAAACRLAHSIKGVAGNLSAGRLYEQAQRLESAMADADDVLNALEAFRLALGEAVASSAAFTAAAIRPHPTSAPPFEATSVARLMRELDRALERQSMRAGEQVGDVRDALSSQSVAEMDLLVRQVDGLRFREARQTLARIAKALELSLAE